MNCSDFPDIMPCRTCRNVGSTYIVPYGNPCVFQEWIEELKYGDIDGIIRTRYYENYLFNNTYFEATLSKLYPEKYSKLMKTKLLL